MTTSENQLRSLLNALTILPEEFERTELQQAFWQQVAACRTKNYNEEGIPMYLVLEDVSDVPLEQIEANAEPDNALNAMLVTASEFFRQQMQTQQEDLSSKDISTILEVLAECYLVSEDPSAGASADEATL